MQNRQRGIGQAGLDPAHVGAEQTAALGQFLLGDCEISPQLLDAQTQRFSRISKGGNHPMTI